jgi:S-adenosylmethionine decarboxylase
MSKTRKLSKTCHIIFDAIGCDRNLLNDEHLIFRLLIEIPKLIDMKILSGPNIVRDYDENNLGITGFAIVSFSHISIHTFTNTQEIYVDVFSCKPFDYDKVRKYLHEKLKVSEEQVETFEVRYPWENKEIEI